MAKPHKRQTVRTMPQTQQPVPLQPLSNPLEIKPEDVALDKELTEQFQEKVISDLSTQLASGELKEVEQANEGMDDIVEPGKLGDDQWLLNKLRETPVEKSDYLNAWTTASEPIVDINFSEGSKDGSDDGVAVEQTPAASSETVPVAEPEFDYAAYCLQHSIPEGWTHDNIDQWIAAGGYNSGTTENDNFVIDPTRKSRAISTWPVSELVDGLKDRLDGIDEGNFGELAKAYRQLETVDPAWSITSLIDFVRQGLEPSKTSNGAWREDVTRARRLASEWTTQELIAWALGEIRALGATTDITVAKELNERLDLGVHTGVPSDVIATYRRTKNNDVKVVGEQPTAVTPVVTTPEVKTETVTLPGLTSMNAGYLKTQTERYLKACAPGTPINMEIGTTEQRQLDNLFRYILKLEDPVAFGSALTYFRDFYAKHRDGLFEPTYASRFTGTLRTDGFIQETHVNLLAILHVYTDPNKAARKQIDLPYLLRNFPVDKQSLLLEFFQRYC